MMARALPVPPLGRQTVLSRLDLPSHPHGSVLRASKKRATVSSSLDRIHAVVQELDIEQSAFRRASCLPCRAQREVDAKRVPATTKTDDRPILRPVFFIYEHAT